MYTADVPIKKQPPTKIIKKSKKDSPFQKSKRIQSDYERKLRGVSREVRKLIQGYNPIDLTSLEKLKQALYSYSELIEPWAKSIVEKMIIDISNQDKNAWREHTKTMSLSLQKEILNAPTGQALKDLMEENVILIKSIPIEAAQKVHDKVIKNLSEGKRYADFISDILNVGDITLNRAILIARTETARAANVFVRVRAEHVGATTYIWHASKDKLTRKSHREMDGHEFRFDTPPTLSDGTITHPGEIYNCRCWGEPVINDIY